MATRSQGEARPVWQAASAPRILLVAGEASGDLHGADLIVELRRRVPNLEVVGLGGERLRQAGMHTIADAAEMLGLSRKGLFLKRRRRGFVAG